MKRLSLKLILIFCYSSSIILGAFTLLFATHYTQAQDALKQDGETASEPKDPFEGLRSKLQDSIPTQERKAAIDAIIERSSPEQSAGPLVSLLEQRAPRKPFEQLVALLLDKENGVRYRREEFLAPLALALSAGDLYSDRIRLALQAYPEDILLETVRKLLKSREVVEQRAGARISRMRPGGSLGVASFLPELVALLASQDRELREEVYESLQQATFLNLPQSPQAWKDLIHNKNQNEILALLSDAAFAHLSKLQSENNQLQEELLAEITWRMRYEQKNTPKSLVQRLESPHEKVRLLAVEFLGELLAEMKKEDADFVLAAFAERFASLHKENEKVLLRIAETFSTLPGIALPYVSQLLVYSGQLSTSVKLSLIKALATPEAFELVVELLNLSPQEFSDPIQLQLIEQIKLVASAEAKELLVKVFHVFQKRMEFIPSEAETASYQREVVEILETLRYLVSIKAIDIRILIPTLVAGADEHYSERQLFFRLFNQIAELLKHEESKETLFEPKEMEILQGILEAYLAKPGQADLAAFRELTQLHVTLRFLSEVSRFQVLKLYEEISQKQSLDPGATQEFKKKQELLKILGTLSIATMSEQDIAEKIQGLFERCQTRKEELYVVSAILTALKRAKIKNLEALIIQAFESLVFDESKFLIALRFGQELKRLSLFPASKQAFFEPKLEKLKTSFRSHLKNALTHLEAAAEESSHHAMKQELEHYKNPETHALFFSEFITYLEENSAPSTKRLVLSKILKEELAEVPFLLEEEIQAFVLDGTQESFKESLLALRSHLEEKGLFTSW